MYCIKCGVGLDDGEKICPLCGTEVLQHPQMEPRNTQRKYPANRYPVRELRPSGWVVIATVCIVLAMLITVTVDLQINATVTWSGYVLGALVLLYTAMVLPYWFRRPNPVIFVPVSFAVLAGYLLYIDLVNQGGWFLSFGFPVTGGMGLIITAMVTLLRYLKRGRLYIIGSTFVAVGGFMLLLEFLLHITFGRAVVYWSVFPLSVFVLLGLFFIFLGICRPAREALERKFFF